MNQNRQLSPTMNGSDAVLWAIEADRNLRSTVTAVALLDRPPRLADLRQRVGETVEAFPRLRQRVAEPSLGLGPPYWVDATGFDLDSHVHLVDGAGMAEQELLAFAAQSAREGIDRAAPLWQLSVVDSMEGGGAAVIVKFHHSLTDGVGGMALMLSLLDWSRYPTERAHLRPVEVRYDQLGESLIGRLLGSMAAGTRLLARLPGSALRSAARPLDSAAATWATAGSLVRLLAPGTRRLSPLFEGHSDRWTFDTYERPMEDLRRSARAAGGTINDVFMAAVAGGLYRYHVKLDQEITHLRVNLPVSFREAGDPVGGNLFTPVRFVVPVDEPDPHERVRQLGTICRRWRTEPALPLTETVAGLLSRLPAQATTALLASMMYGVDFVATNVPGIEQPSYIAGAEVLRQFAFAPLAGAAVNISLVSHAGIACVGINMDQAAVSDPALLTACLRDGFDEVAGHTG